MRTVIRIVAAALLPMITACGQPSSRMDCEGEGAVLGNYRNINDGELTFAFGLAWRTRDGGYKVLFTRDKLFAEALRASPSPDEEMHRVGQLLGELLVGFEFHADGRYHQRTTQGISSSRGWSGADSGRAKLDGEGCLRGDVKLDSYGGGHFALPLHTGDAAGLLERDLRPEREAGTQAIGAAQDPLQLWRKAYARLREPHSVIAVQAMGFSAPVATVLANDKRVNDVLLRFRSQCPDPATAIANEYGEITGASHPKPGIVLEGIGVVMLTAMGAVIDNCYVMQRNGESIDQCWPLRADCTSSPLYVSP